MEPKASLCNGLGYLAVTQAAVSYCVRSTVIVAILPAGFTWLKHTSLLQAHTRSTCTFMPRWVLEASFPVWAKATNRRDWPHQSALHVDGHGGENLAKTTVDAVPALTDHF